MMHTLDAIDEYGSSMKVLSFDRLGNEETSLLSKGMSNMWKSAPCYLPPQRSCRAQTLTCCSCSC